MDIPKKPSPANIKILNVCSGISGGVENMEYHSMSLLGYSIWPDNEKICETAINLETVNYNNKKWRLMWEWRKSTPTFCRIKTN